MGITYEDAVKAKKEIRSKLLADPNVVSIGVVAEKNELGESTGNFAIQVGVISIEAYVRAQRQGQSSIPSELLLSSNDSRGTEKHVHFYVVREGKIEALAQIPDNDTDDVASATDELPITTQSMAGYTIKRRPSPCGQSIGHPDTTAGTQGLLLEYTEGPNAGKAYILSNNHVIAANNLASVGDAITQPGNYDSGIVGRDTIAFLSRWVPLLADGLNYVDCAVAEAKGGRNWARYVSPHITHIGTPTKIIDPSFGMFVEKVGRTTGHTQGEITSSNTDINIDYPMGRLMFADQIRTTNMSKGGDSGSCLIKKGTRQPVGLLFAGSDTASYHNPIRTVISSLSMSYTCSYPSGKTHHFKNDYPFRIIQRRPYTSMSAYHVQHKFLLNSRILFSRQRSKAAPSIAAICTASFTIASSLRENNLCGFLSTHHSVVLPKKHSFWRTPITKHKSDEDIKTRRFDRLSGRK